MSHSDVPWYYLDLEVQLGSIVKGKITGDCSNLYLYNLYLFMYLSPLPTNPFISEIVLTTVTGKSLQIQRFLFSSGDDNINKVLEWELHWTP